MAISPITTVKLRPFSIQSDGSGSLLHQFIDMGDHLIINGVRYSPDLTTCYGVVSDPSAYGVHIRVPKVAFCATSLTNLANTTNWGQWPILHNPGYDHMIKASATKRYTAMTSGNGGSTTGLASYDITGTVTWVNSSAPVTSYNQFGVIKKSANEFWQLLCPIGSYYPTMYRFDAAGALIGTAQQTTVTGMSASGLWCNKIIDVADGVAMIMTTPGGPNGNTTWSMAGFTATNKTYIFSSASPSYVSAVRPGIAVYDTGKFYSIEMPQTVGSRCIRWNTITSALTTPSTTLLTTDYTPFVDQNIPASGSSDVDYRIQSEVVTFGGKKYLVIVFHAYMQTPAAAYNNQSKIVVYAINDTDPTQLTLNSSKVISRSSMVVIDGNKVYCGRTGSVDVYTLSDASIDLVNTIAIDVRAIIKTEAGVVIGLEPSLLRAYNITANNQKVINCRFGQTSTVLTNNQPITSTVMLDVTDGTGVRQVADVDLVINGGTFGTGVTTTRVTTSATETLSIPVTISTIGTVSVIPTLVV